MRPPICEVCDDAFDPGSGGALLSFRKGESGRSWDERAEAEGFTGHPPYAGWFCAHHVAAARARTHLSLREALEDMG